MNIGVSGTPQVAAGVDDLNDGGEGPAAQRQGTPGMDPSDPSVEFFTRFQGPQGLGKEMPGQRAMLTRGQMVGSTRRSLAAPAATKAFTNRNGPLAGADRGLSAHILPTSATMIGVCLTALYISLLSPMGAQRMVIDKLLAVDTLVFLLSATLSFMSMRARTRGAAYEASAEAIFLAGLGLLSLGAVVLAFVVS